MPVHQIGLAADMDAFSALADERDIALVEDAAPALGATYKGRAVGALGPVACFSFHARKVITTGEGGMVVTSDPELAARLRRLRHHGMSVSDLERHAATDIVFESYDEVGFNYRMSDIQAALGLAQMEVLDEALSRRRRLAERYAKGLGQNEHIGVPIEPDGYRHSWQSYSIRLRPDAPVTRDQLMRALLADGIPTRRGVTASHLEPPYRATAPTLPHTEAAARETMLLPLYPDLTDGEQDLVVDRLLNHVGG
jgi:perosamine synthetase